MKNIKVLLVLAVFLISSIAYAQPQGGGQQKGQQGTPPIPNATQVKKMVEKLSTELSLSEGQESKISELFIAHFEEVKAKTKSGQPKREEMEALKTGFENKVKSLLSAEQQKLFVAYMKKQTNQADQQRPKR